MALTLVLALVFCPVPTSVQGDTARARAEVLGREVAANPYDARRMRAWAFALREAGDPQGARDALERSMQDGDVNAGCLYSLACMDAILGHPDSALDLLERALDAGFTDDAQILSDSDLESLRELPRFKEITGLYPPAGLTRDERWRYDLAFFARRMERMHWDLYAKFPEPEFQRAVAELAAKVPELGDGALHAGLQRIVARVGDGHTTLAEVPVGGSRLERFPLDLYLFRDGLYVVGAPRDQAALVGGRVLSLGELPVERALEAMRAYVSVDNEMGYRDGAPGALTAPDVLEAIGSLEPGAPLDLGFEKDGRRERVWVERGQESPGMPRSSGEMGRKATAGMVYADAGCSAPLPLWRHEPEKSLRLEDVPAARLVYFWFGALIDPPGDRFEAFCARLFAHIAEVEAENLVIDMRLNGGGDTGLVLPLIHGLVRCDAVNRSGHLFVITGRRTFSAAMNTCSLLELHTAATFVGEPTGSRPNFVGESTSFVLPCTRLRVYCSSRYWQHVSSTDKRPWIAPAIVAEPTFADWAAHRDPVLEAILERLR